MKKVLYSSVLMMLIGMFAVAPSLVRAESEATPAATLVVVKYDADW
jgi:hypothetical protein